MSQHKGSYKSRYFQSFLDLPNLCCSTSASQTRLPLTTKPFPALLGFLPTTTFRLYIVFQTTLFILPNTIRTYEGIYSAIGIASIKCSYSHIHTISSLYIYLQ